MDPTANLAEQLAIAQGVIDIADRRDTNDINGRDALRLAELVLALNEWIVKGGFLPEQWKR